MSHEATKTVTLSRPIERKGAEQITAVTLREPSAGAMRGLKLLELVRMDVASVEKILPRITDPALLPDELATMNAADFFNLSSVVTSFLMTPAELAAAQAAADAE